MENDLICNFKKCRKRLTTFAWATSCSHIFCDEDGTRQFNQKLICPACETELPGKFDVIRIDLQPSEQYKSMVLAGQRPEVIMEVCSRALSFWSYQAHQERTYQEYCSVKGKEQLQQVEEYYKQLLSSAQSDLSSAKAQVDSIKAELEETKIKSIETSEKLKERNRQYQKLQMMYDSIRRHNVTVATFDSIEKPGIPKPHRFIRQKEFELPVGTVHKERREPAATLIPNALAHTDGAHASATAQLPSQDAGATAATTGRWAGGEECQIDPSLIAALNSGQRVKSKESFNLEFSHPAVLQKLQQRLP